MGVGRNLAYRRSVFFGNKGFGTHNHIISGDDDLFVNTNATGDNTAVEIQQRNTYKISSMLSISMTGLHQKKRHLTTAPYYKFRDKFLLITEPLTRILFYSSFIILLIFLYLWPWVVAVFGLRLINTDY